MGSEMCIRDSSSLSASFLLESPPKTLFCFVFALSCACSYKLSSFSLCLSHSLFLPAASTHSFTLSHSSLSFSLLYPLLPLLSFLVRWEGGLS